MSNLTFAKPVLLAALTKLKTTSAGAKTSLSELNHVYFDGTWAFTYDGQHMSRVPFASDFVGSAPLISLSALLTNSPSKNVKAKVSEDTNVRWQCGRSHGTFATLPNDSWPIRMEPFDTQFPPEDSDDNRALADAIRSVIPRVVDVAGGDTDGSRSPGICLRVSETTVAACAQDNIRAGLSYVTGKFEKRKTIAVYGAFVKVLKNCPVDGLQFYCSENWMGLRFAEGYEVFARTLDVGFKSKSNPSGTDYGYKLVAGAEPNSYAINVDDAFIQAVKSLHELGKDVEISIILQSGALTLFGQTQEPAAEMSLSLGEVRMLEADEDPPSDEVTFCSSHVIKLLTHDSRIHIVETECGKVLLIDAHGARFIVALIQVDSYA